MVKVIKIDPKKRITKKIDCRECGATLEYMTVDIKERRGTDYGGGPDGRQWIYCPNCGNDVTIKSW